MRNLILKALGGIALVICLSAMFTSAWGSGQGGGGRLEGAWDVQVTILNCQTGVPLRPSFASATDFMSGGTLVDTTSGLPPALRTPGQGVWRHVSGNTYRFSFRSFSFDAAGNYIGLTKITHEAALDSNGNHYTSVGTSETYAPNGTFVSAGCSSTTATRFE